MSSPDYPQTNKKVRTQKVRVMHNFIFSQKLYYQIQQLDIEDQ